MYDNSSSFSTVTTPGIYIDIHIAIYIYICLYTYILVAPCFKNILRLEAGYPALRCHIVEEEHTSPQRLEIIPPGFGLVGIIIRDRNTFLLETKASNQQELQSGVRSRRTSCPRSSSSRVKGTRRGRLSHLQQLAAGGPAARAAPAAVW